mmetsp:Transcript_55905/g.155891  ORF Transcript_55905/g.155891 Transcript_55905/m.155891 type:complete len:246 (-) Transcript_55905:323-1060(-)
MRLLRAVRCTAGVPARSRFERRVRLPILHHRAAERRVDKPKRHDVLASRLGQVGQNLREVPACCRELLDGIVVPLIRTPHWAALFERPTIVAGISPDAGQMPAAGRRRAEGVGLQGRRNEGVVIRPSVVRLRVFRHRKHADVAVLATAESLVRAVPGESELHCQDHIALPGAEPHVTERDASQAARGRVGARDASGGHCVRAASGGGPQHRLPTRVARIYDLDMLRGDCVRRRGRVVGDHDADAQ